VARAFVATPLASSIQDSGIVADRAIVPILPSKEINSSHIAGNVNFEAAPNG